MSVHPIPKNGTETENFSGKVVRYALRVTKIHSESHCSHYSVEQGKAELRIYNLKTKLQSFITSQSQFQAVRMYAGTFQLMIKPKACVKKNTYPKVNQRTTQSRIVYSFVFLFDFEVWQDLLLNFSFEVSSPKLENMAKLLFCL